MSPWRALWAGLAAGAVLGADVSQIARLWPSLADLVAFFRPFRVPF